MPMIVGMIVEAGDDETMIAETIVAAAEAMKLYTGTLKAKVGPVARILILTVRIVNVWYPYATFFTALTLVLPYREGRPIPNI
jgi:hypothetical protein